jgi:thiamine pyrophosphokinase
VARLPGAIVLADGEVPPRALLDAAWPGWADGLDLVVAADGGARHAAALGLTIDSWIGDGDSVDAAQLAALDAGGAAIHRVATDKDETDTELALLLALEAGATQVAILGALGGPRLDHALANLALLEHPAGAGVRVVIYDPRAARVTLLSGPGEARLRGRVGDLVTLVPVGDDAVGVTTGDLRFPLVGETLRLGMARGVSNVRTAPTARVSLESGRLLVIETPVTVGS